MFRNKNTTEDHKTLKTAISIGVVSFKAGVGKSLISVNLAYQLQRLSASVLMVDLSLPFGAGYIFARRAETWHTIRPLLGSLVNARKLDTVVQPTEYEFKYLAAPQKYEENTRLAPSELRNMVASLHEYIELSIFDLPAITAPSDFQMLSCFNKVLCIMTPEPEVVRATATAHEYLRSQKMSENLHFILNRWDRASIPHFKTELEKRLGISVSAEIEEDSDAVWKHYFSGKLFQDERLIITQDIKNLASLISK